MKSAKKSKPHLAHSALAYGFRIAYTKAKGGDTMMYPFMTLQNETEVVHSQIIDNNRVKVYFEQPICGGFKSAACYLPDYEWEGITGFTNDEIADLQEYLQSTAHLIYRFAQEGGFGNASNL